MSGFPEGFFYREAGPEFPLGSLLFRGRRYSTKVKQDLYEAHTWAELLFEIAISLTSKVERVRVAIPSLPSEGPSAAAKLARSALGLSPDRPIPHLIHALESHGVLVIAIPAPLPGREAFSAWAVDLSGGRVPIIMLPPGASGDRLRFTVAHELDHLIAHPTYRGYVREIEDVANSFASEFLTPESGIRDEIPKPVTVQRLVPLKRRWGVSIASLIMRAGELGLISKRRVQQLFREMTMSGERFREPGEVSLEKPRALRKLIEIVYGNPPDIRRFAADFDLPLQLANAVISAHATRSELIATVPTEEPTNILRFDSSHIDSA